MRYFLFAMALAALVFPSAVHAASATPATYAVPSQQEGCEAYQGIDWRETGAGAFRILYPVEYDLLGRVLAASLEREALDGEYARFASLFESALSLPVAIRVYPDTRAFTCLNNAQPEEIAPGTLHTHVGAREIALMGNNVAESFSAWAQNDVNLIRYEIGVLFARQIAGDHLPPGLLEAVGYYVQDPHDTIGTLRLNLADWREPRQDWRALWEDRPTADLSRKLQATSTVAYLVDTYGWEAFVSFLHSLPAAQGFPQALSRAYGKDFAALEDEWRAYYPRYFQGRWQVHAIYNFDLAPYEALIDAEKYSEADREIQKAMAFLEKTQQGEKHYQALLLLATARKGLEAETLFTRSQNAFRAGQYPEALALLEQAEQKYAETTNRFYHLDALAAHREQIKQVMALHGELRDVEGAVETDWNTFALANRLITLGRRLSELGDTQGHAQVMEMARLVEDRQRGQYGLLSGAVIGMALALLVLLARMLRRKPPPEAQL